MTGYADREKIHHDLSRFQLRPWREIAVLALIIMELSWIAAWYLQLISGPQRLTPLAIYLLLGMLMLIVYWVTRFMLTLQFRRDVRRAMLGALIAVGYIALLRFLIYPGEPITPVQFLNNIQTAFADPQRPIPVEFSMFLLTGYVCYRGAALAHRWIGIFLVRKMFQYGIVLLLFLGIVSAFMPAISVLPIVFVFLTAGFVAMGAARTSTLRALRGASRFGFDGIWLLSLFVAAVAAVQSAALVGMLAAAWLPALLVFVVVFMTRVLLVLGAVLAIPIFLILALIFPWLEERLSSAPMIAAIEEEIQELFQFIVDLFVAFSELLQEFYLNLPDLTGAKPYVLWTGVLILLGMLIWSLGRFKLLRMREAGKDLQDERTTDQQAARLWLERLLHEGWNRLSGRFSSGGRTGYLGALRIRRIYALLTRLCERLEVPRASTVTPLEYLDELELLFPEERGQVRAITHAYNRVRYGELPETPEEVRDVERAWRQVRQRARDLQAVRRHLSNKNA